MAKVPETVKMNLQENDMTEQSTTQTPMFMASPTDNSPNHMQPHTDTNQQNAYLDNQYMQGMYPNQNGQASNGSLVTPTRNSLIQNNFQKLSKQNT